MIHIIDNCRIDALGDITARLQVWELVYVSALLTGSETWTDIDEKAVESLDKLQNQMYRSILNLPKSTPSPAMCLDLGGVLMKWRIVQRKLVFLHHILNQDKESLSHQMLMGCLQKL